MRGSAAVAIGLAVGWLYAGSALARPRHHVRRSHRGHVSHSRTRHPSHALPDKLPQESSSQGEASAGVPPPHRGPARIDFDSRLIQGQTNKAGAIYLYDRKPLKIRSMVHLRQSFRQEIYDSVVEGP